MKQSQETIDGQITLINIHRQRLRIQMKQLRVLGINAPPYMIHEINNSRREILSIKEYLNSNGASIQDDIVDTVSEWEKEFGVGE